MHKTLYIDIDEEITSIVDRIRKISEREVIIVAPKNALLLQSIVNLKLLKKEADRRKKSLLIITQDKVGKKLIEKAGILVQAKNGEDLYLDADPGESSYEPMYPEVASEIKSELQKEDSNKSIGSSSYFDEDDFQVSQANEREKVQEIGFETKNKIPEPKKKIVSKGPFFQAKESIIVKKENRNSERDEKSRINMSDIVVSQPPKKEKKSKIKTPKISPEKSIVVDEKEAYAQSFSEFSSASRSSTSKNQVSIKKAEKFFRGARKAKKDFETLKVRSGSKKFFIFFVAVFFLFVALAGGYFFLPKADLQLQMRNEEKSISLDLTAFVQQDKVNSEENSILANLERKNEEIKKEFPATGSKDGGSKAQGKLVIYNEYGKENQPLVATTRLETSEGKIFRIKENIVVPGFSSIGDEKKPGAIEVEVVADQPGEEYNIDSAEFKIVGFKNNQEKYEKLYAKSFASMTGGGNGSAKFVTAEDIDSAKRGIIAEAKKTAIEAMKKNISPDSRIFEDSVQIEIFDVSVSEKAGTEKNTFFATAKIQAATMSFQETDVKKIIIEKMVESGVESKDIAFNKPINYILSDSDINQGRLVFSAKTDADSLPSFDIENFRKGVLGKNAGDVENYAKRFSAIQKVEISFWPFFVKRLPMSEGRVNIDIRASY